MSAEAQAPGLPDPVGRGEEPLYHYTRIYLLFLQGLFKQFLTSNYRWSDDEERSEIAITDQVPIPKDVIEKRPAIVTMRGPAQFANLSLDQMRKVNARTGMKERTDLIACTMSLNCIAKQGVEAQRIGWIVMRHLRTFKEMIQRCGFHKIADELSMSPETPPGALIAGEGDFEAVMVTVYSPFFVQWTEEVTPLYAPVAQNIWAHLRAGIPTTPVDASGRENLRNQLRPPSLRGRVLRSIPPVADSPIIQTVKT